MSAPRRELARLLALAGPAAATQLSAMLLWTVDLLMVGRVSVEAFNAVSLGRLWTVGTAIIALGLVYGLDPLASQAHGAGDVVRLTSVLRHALALAVLISVPVGGLWLATGPLLRLWGQDPAIAELAHRYVIVQLPTLPCFLLFMTLKQFLQARGVVRPAMWVSFGGNFANAFLNWLLIFGHWGLPRLGAVGAGVATAITQALMLAALGGVVARYGLFGDLPAVWARAARVRAELVRIVVLGVPIGLQLALEYWAFSIATLWAGWLSAVDLASHSIALNLASISYMLPLGVSFAASTRVGNLIGEGDRAGAQRAAWISLLLGGGVMLGAAALFVVARTGLPALYGAEGEVLALSATLLPIVAAFQLFDGLQVVGGGVLRGMGRPRPAAAANLVGYYLIALPLAWWLAFRGGLGLAGIWYGLALGLACVAVLEIAWIWWRGPRTVEALV